MHSHNLPRSSRPRSTQRRRFVGGCLGAVLLVITGILVSVIGVLLIYLILPPAPLNVLVLGMDARPGEGYATRTDSIMLIGLNPRGLQTSILSIPRDLFIETPGYGLQRINTINGLGEIEAEGRGPALLSDAIDFSFGVRPDRYIRLNFAAFVELIDAVGGVDIDVQRAIYDPQYPTPDGGVELVTFAVGWQHMDGATALKYARTRHSDDDYFRAGRQQQIVDAFLKKLINPLTWPTVSATLARNVDANIRVFDLLLYAPVALLGQREQLVIDRNYIRPVQGGAAPDYAKLESWMSGRFE